MWILGFPFFTVAVAFLCSFSFHVLLIGMLYAQADSETDEVYAQMTLQPVSKVCKRP
jgi:hypothetical protein